MAGQAFSADEPAPATDPEWELSEDEWGQVVGALNLRARHVAEAQSFRGEKG